jgi:PAS domain S-box-containing protein
MRSCNPRRPGLERITAVNPDHSPFPQGSDPSGRVSWSAGDPHQFRIFDTTLSAVTDSIYIMDREGRFLYANKALLLRWRLSLAEAVGKTCFDLKYPPELAAKINGQIQEVVSTGRILTDETSYTGPTGETGYYEYIFSPVIGADGTVEAVAGSTRDITQRRRRELDNAFLAGFQTALAEVSTTEEILRVAGAQIAGHLRLTHCLLAEINDAADESRILYDHHAPGHPDLVGLYRLSDFLTPEERAAMAAGHTTLIDDVRCAPRSAANRARFVELGVISLANAGYYADGRWKFILSALKAEPYAWTQEEADLLNALAARTCLRLDLARADETLRQSEERWRGTFENAAIGMAHVGLDGRWLTANQAICNITGYSFDELAGMTFAQITHPDDLNADLAQVARILSGEISTYSMEKRYLRKDGAPVWTNLTVSLARDRHGRPLHFISAIEDITQRKAASETSERRQRFVERLTHVMPSVLYVLNLPDRSPVWANRHVGAAIGYTDAEIAAMGGEFHSRAMHPDDFAALPSQLEKLARLRDGEVLEWEHRLLRRDGEWRWFLNRETPFSRDPDGSVREIIGTATDITERRRIEMALKVAKEESEAANRSKDRFLAVLSHELRTPLAPILMTAAELHGDPRLPMDVRDHLGMIERNVALEARLIDDLLDHTRIVTGKLTMRTELCDAHSLLRLVVDMVRAEAEAKEIRIELDLSASRNHLIGDPARLQQVFWNLIRNGVKFSNPGDTVRVRCFDIPPRITAGGELNLCVEVIDHGIGFEPAAAERIFHPFEQIHQSASYGGLGLGLAIARAIVEIHGGAIRAESPGAGMGARFTVELHAAERSATECGTIANGHLPAHTDDGAPEIPLRLLIVEDHEPTMRVLTRLLNRAGHSTITAMNLAEARAAASSQHFDLVISDLGLPDGTGVDLMSHLHSSYGLRGIALSGYGTDDDLRRSEAAGFVAHLVKPVDFNDLKLALRQFVTVARPGDPAAG